MNQKVYPKKRLVKLLAFVYLWDSIAVPFFRMYNSVLDTAYNRSEYTPANFFLMLNLLLLLYY